MRYSQMLIPTVKEVPADAEIPSHQLMVRAGLMRKLSSGTYSYLPLGFRCLLKVIQIVREEMNRAGAQELLLPCVQPIELWQQTGRNVDYGPTMARFTDRHGRENVLAPTAEEVITALAANEIQSYKQLPMNLYQISFKFRDEFRPRFGVLRSREFIMKDSYSFHSSEKCLDQTYRKMYDAYCRIFKRCGLDYVIVEAESGEMGGSGSHQFTIPCDNGEDIIVYTEDGSYAANIEKAAVDPVAKADRDPSAESPKEVNTPDVGSIEAVCEFLKTQPRDMIKTLIYTSENGIIAALVRGDHELNPEKLTQVLGGIHNELADEQTIEKVTQAAVGFAGPIGLEKKLHKMVIDHAVAAMAVGVTGANKTDYHLLGVVPGRDFALEGETIMVEDIRNAAEGDTYNGKPLKFKRGIEVGQVFKLGTKYSSKLNATFLDENGVEIPCLMGCYGIGINRIIASTIETSYDENGIIWPISIAPFEVIVTSVNQDEPDVVRTADTIYDQLVQHGVEVLLDDRDMRGGVKFKDADLLGIPLRITVGKKAVAQGEVESKRRDEGESHRIAIDQAVEQAMAILADLKAAQK